LEGAYRVVSSWQPRKFAARADRVLNKKLKGGETLWAAPGKRAKGLDTGRHPNTILKDRQSGVGCLAVLFKRRR